MICYIEAELRKKNIWIYLWEDGKIIGSRYTRMSYHWNLKRKLNKLAQELVNEFKNRKKLKIDLIAFGEEWTKKLEEYHETC